MAKSEVYSWRLDRTTKRALEEAARLQRRTIASLLAGIVDDWLRRTPSLDDDAEQARVRAAAMRWVGKAASGESRRSERVRKLVRSRLQARRAS